MIPLWRRRRRGKKKRKKKKRYRTSHDHTRSQASILAFLNRTLKVEAAGGFRVWLVFTGLEALMTAATNKEKEKKKKEKKEERNHSRKLHKFS
jgi:hypothetical protein